MTVQQSARAFRAFTRRVSVSTTIALWVCLVTTIALFITSALMPPKGVIDPSMFEAAGYIFAFATLVVVREGVREGLGVTLTHGDTQLIIRDQDGKPEPANSDSNGAA